MPPMERRPSAGEDERVAKRARRDDVGDAVAQSPDNGNAGCDDDAAKAVLSTAVPASAAALGAAAGALPVTAADAVTTGASLAAAHSGATSSDTLFVAAGALAAAGDAPVGVSGVSADASAGSVDPVAASAGSVDPVAASAGSEDPIAAAQAYSQRTKALGLRRFECHVCSAEFQSGRTLNQHLQGATDAAHMEHRARMAANSGISKEASIAHRAAMASKGVERKTGVGARVVFLLTGDVVEVVGRLDAPDCAWQLAGGRVCKFKT